MKINLIYDAQSRAAPQSFRDGMQTAANILQTAFNDNITININVGYGELKGQPLAGVLSRGGPDQNYLVGYSDLRAALLNSAASADDFNSVNALPKTSSLQSQSNFLVSVSEARALGLVTANDGTIDGSVGMQTSLSDARLVSVALHELTHAMGRVTSSVAGEIDLFRFDAAGHHLLGNGLPPAPASYFSIDGGATDLADFGRTSDPGDFLDPPASNRTPNDPFNENAGDLASLTTADLTFMDVLGFHRAGSAPRSLGTGQVDEWKIGGGKWAGSVDLGNHGVEWRVVGTGDLTGDGSADVLWRNALTGQLDEWKMTNGQWGGSVNLFGYFTDRQLAGVGDFNGDGTADLLWRKSDTGQVEEWRMANGAPSSVIDLGSHGADWLVAGIGDLNHDGTGDVLWRNAVTGQLDEWKMFNGQWAGSVDLGTHPAGWDIAGVGDFNHDGTSDILWYNLATRDVDLWLMSNGKWAGSIDIGLHPAGWQPAGVGDFNGDGTSDVLWFNPTTGNTEIWIIANGHWAATSDLGSHPLGWVPAGIGDFNHDGTSDVLWRF